MRPPFRPGRVCGYKACRATARRSGQDVERLTVGDILYSTRVLATGGRKGSIRSEDAILDLKLAMPKELRGMGGATNPEQLFAGGYAACFENALLRVARQTGHRFADGDVEVVAEAGLSRTPADTFVLHASLAITIAGINRQGAERLVEAADAICPYSNAIRGNVTVAKTISVR
ncbi:MAG: organic hydroperoxide resistance protein [Rhizobiaceae bacterium]|nr:organic hydroperoxide resistance protein [Rhizobiaceae bacterium]